MFVLFSCEVVKPESESVEKPYGEYESDMSDGFIVDLFSYPATFISYGDMTDKDNKWNFKGIIIRYVDNEDKSGYFVIKITDNNSYDAGFPVDYSYFEVGKFTVIPWKDLSDDSNECKMSTPYHATDPVSFDTPQTAIDTIISDLATYCGFFGTYKK